MSPGTSQVSNDILRAQELLGLMRGAVFTLCPTGDVPDSPRIYQVSQRFML